MASVISILTKKKTLLKDIQSLLPKSTLHLVENPDTDEQFKKSHVIVADFDIFGPHMYNLPNAKWVQGTWAGVESLFKYVVPNEHPGFDITRFSGKHFGALMTEYVIANIINQERSFFEVRENQKNSKWVIEGKIFEHRNLHDLSIGILGLGTIGNQIAINLKYMGANVIGFGRKLSIDTARNQHISEYYNNNNLAGFLQKCDYFINVLPSTAETQGLLNGNVLKSCKDRHTIFVNIGRGSVISEESLVNALQMKWLAGAILDVHENEPLQKESVLWTMENVFISPHVAGVSRSKDVAEHFAANYKLYEENLPVQPLVDISKGY